MGRSFPNIIITGTPAVGKTSTCSQLISLASDNTPPIPLHHLQINQLVKDRGCHQGWDDKLQSWIVDEDRLIDEVGSVLGEQEGGQAENHDRHPADHQPHISSETEPQRGGWLIDWHACDLFPTEWIDLVVVLRCEQTETLYDRLVARKYHDQKVQENLDVEIFGVLAEEAREAYPAEMVVELKSEKVEDVEENCERILQWVTKWMEDRK